MLFALCFVAVAREDISHQHAPFSHADVPFLPVSPGREGDIDPLMFLQSTEWDVLAFAWHGCTCGDV